MLAEGYYAGRVHGGKVTTSSKKGTPQFEINVGVWDGTQEHRKTARLFLSDAAYPYSVEKLERLGFNGNFEAPEFGEAVTANWVDGLIEVRHEEYEGKMQERVEIAGNGGGGEPAPANVIRDMNARWKQRKAAPPPPAGKPSAPPPRAAAPTQTKSLAPATLADVNDRDTCWSYFCSLPSNKNGPRMDDWRKAVNSHAASVGRAEGAFNSEDWVTVAGGFAPF